MAAALLEAHLDAMCVRATVSSAGSQAGATPAAPEAVAAMARRGIDLSGHRSRRLAPEMVGQADLVLGLAREHVREVVLLEPDAWSRTFTLKELVRRAEAVGPRSAGQPLAEWLSKLHVGRERAQLLGSSATDDVADPMGGPAAAFEVTATELAELIERLVRLVWGAA